MPGPRPHRHNSLTERNRPNMTPEQIAALKAQAAPAPQGESGYVSWKPEPGDELVGKIIAFDKGPATAARPDARILVVQPEGSETSVSVWVTPARLRDLVERLIMDGNLVVGGNLYIQRVENVKTKNGRFMNDYIGSAVPPTATEAANDEAPF